eukprot:scaffold95825_cov59-Attheya_sp.AAC.5
MIHPPPWKSRCSQNRLVWKLFQFTISKWSAFKPKLVKKTTRKATRKKNTKKSQKSGLTTTDTDASPVDGCDNSPMIEDTKTSVITMEIAVDENISPNATM